MPKVSAPRDHGINTLRAFAIFIVVVYHALIIMPEGGSVFYDEFEAFTRYIALEIFTAMSGYLYAGRLVTRSSIAPSIRTKARRLLVPLVTMTTLLLCMRMVLPGVNQVPEWSDVLHAYAFRFEHLWYLQSLFLIFVVMAFLDGFDLLRGPRAWLALILCWYAISLVLPLNSFFGYAGLVQLMPFFLVGYGLRRWPALLESGRITLLAWMGFAGGMLLEQLDFRGVLSLPDIVVLKWGLLDLIAGSAFCFLAVRYRRGTPTLAAIGEFSFSIYIFHTIGMAVANRVASLTPWDEGFMGLVVLKVILGMCLPIILELGIRRSAVLSTLFLGDAWKPKRPALYAEAKSVPAGQ